MILQLDPPINLHTPKGPSLCHFLIDYGPEMDLFYVCFQANGEIWTWNNRDVRAEKNVTLGRTLENVKNEGCSTASLLNAYLL